MSPYTRFTLISWSLQTAVAIAFLIALYGLARTLKRPAMRVLADGWLVVTVGIIAGTVSVAVDPQGVTPTLSLVFAVILAATVGATMPTLFSAAASLAQVPDVPMGRLLERRMLLWAVAYTASILAVVAIGRNLLPDQPWFIPTVGRLVPVGGYLAGAAGVLSIRRRAAPKFRRVLGAFALGVALNSLRPLAVMYLRNESLAGGLSDWELLALVTVHVLSIIVLGVVFLLMAFTEERVAVSNSAIQLRNAAIRVERAHRMESIGRLASGVAHDFNNVLAVIVSSVSLARDAQTDRQGVETELGEIEKAAARGAGLTRQLLSFARQQPAKASQFDIVDAVERMRSLLTRLVGAGVDIRVTRAGAPSIVNMDPVQFEQVLVNLVANARDAMPAGGVIDITIDTRVLVEPRQLPDDVLAPGPFVLLAIEDTGRGMTEAVMERLFEPFFTTRADEGGTGLGLATVQGIVRQAGGDITVTSELGNGARFEVLLPAALS